jgi:transcriptional regulator with XRE-family HTH domain
MAKHAASGTTVRVSSTGAQARPSRTVLDNDALALGSRIRERRRALGLSLVRLAALTDLSHPFLSQVERGHARPSVTSLQRIAAALGVDAGWLFAADDEREVVQVVAGNSPRPLRVADGQPEGAVRTVAAPGWGAAVDDIVDLPDRFGDLSTSDGDLLCYVLDGAAEVEVDGNLHQLGVHDAIFIAGTVTYGLRAAGGVPARVLAVRVGPGLPATPVAP